MSRGLWRDHVQGLLSSQAMIARPTPPDALLEFDACIDLTGHNTPAGIAGEEAVRRVRAAVEALPGAAWVSVEWCEPSPSSLIWLRLFRRGDARERTGEPAFQELRERITRLVRAGGEG